MKSQNQGVQVARQDVDEGKRAMLQRSTGTLTPPSFQLPQMVPPFFGPHLPSVVTGALFFGLPSLLNAKVSDLEDSGQTETKPPTSGFEVDTPYHGPAETIATCPLSLHRCGLEVVVSNPLIFPCDLLHHRLFHKLRLETFLGYVRFDLCERENTVKIRAGAWQAWPSKGAIQILTAGIGERISYAPVTLALPPEHGSLNGDLPRP